MMLMTTNNAFTEVIENLHFSLDHKMKTATLLPKMNEHYSGDIILPEKVKDNNGVEYSVIALEDSCFENCNGLTSIDIPSSVTSLGNHCFAYCSSLTSIIIPSSVTSLGENCFMCSFNLKSIYFKGMDPKYLSEAFIPTTCRIYVLDEYLVDYKYALGTDYMYIYTWNPKE
jgi:hypothetical protein